MFSAQPWLQPFEVVPSSLNPDLNCLSFKLVIGKDDAKIQLLLLQRNLHIVVCQHKIMKLGRINTRVVFLPFFISWSLSTNDHTRLRRANLQAQAFDGSNDFFEVLDCLCEFRDVVKNTVNIDIVSIYSKV